MWSAANSAERLLLTRPLVHIRRAVGAWLWPTVPRAPSVDGTVYVCHEWLTSAAGSDKVAAELVRVSGAAGLVCFSASPEVVRALGITVPVHQSRFGVWAAQNRRWQLLLPLMPVVWWFLELPGVETLVTSSHAMVNTIRPTGRRFCYCHTPMRYAWDWKLERERLPRPLRPFLPVGAAIFRRIDREASKRVDVYIANSNFVAERIRSYYGREAHVVHPPIDVDWFVPTVDPSRSEFLVAGRLIPYKRADVAVAAATAASLPLVVAGDGPDLMRLRAVAGPTVRFVGAPTNEVLRDLYQNARALVFPGIEDFGMTLVEAQACGSPVIARSMGGALDSIDPSFSGLLVDSDNVDDWAEALRSFRDVGDHLRRHDHAQEFSYAAFDERITAILGL